MKDNVLGKRPLLMVIDVQNDFCAPSGVLAQSGRSLRAIERAVERLDTLVTGWRAAKLPIVFTRLVYDLKKLPPTHRERMRIKKVQGLCAPRSQGIEFYKILPKRGEKVIEKNFYSSFHGTSLSKYLNSKKIDTLLITGVTTHVCPFLTCADAYYEGFRIVALEDCLGTYSGQAFALRYMREQFSATVVKSSLILDQLKLSSRS